MWVSGLRLLGPISQNPPAHNRNCSPSLRPARPRRCLAYECNVTHAMPVHAYTHTHVCMCKARARTAPKPTCAAVQHAARGPQLLARHSRVANVCRHGRHTFNSQRPACKWKEKGCAADESCQQQDGWFDATWPHTPGKHILSQPTQCLAPA